MANAPTDQNFMPAKLAVLNTDTVQGTNLVALKINDTNDGIKVSDSATISFTMIPIDPQDENYRNCWLFQGSDGLTYPVVGTIDGELLIDM